jgi:ketosteroid isomerase-like protein
MFPSMIERRQNKRSLREWMRGAMDTALELVTLGEVTMSAKTTPTAPTAEHPHRRQLDHRRRRARTGMVPPRPQVCTSPVHRPAKSPTSRSPSKR